MNENTTHANRFFNQSIRSINKRALICNLHNVQIPSIHPSIDRVCVGKSTYLLCSVLHLTAVIVGSLITLERVISAAGV